MNNYYRFKQIHTERSLEIKNEFWNSFTMYIKRLILEDWLTENFGKKDYDSGWLWGCDDEILLNRIVEELGIFINIFDVNFDMPKTADILSILEFFYIYISKPIETVIGYGGDRYSSEFDKASARYEYTIYINQLFENHRYSYKMVKGKVNHVASKELNSIYDGLQNESVESELIDLIRRSFNSFSDRTGQKKDDALMIIANALERVKTLEGNNKKKSIVEIIDRIDENPKVREYINILIKDITNISNNCRIRHHEINKFEIKNPAVQDFLYYEYLNIIKLLLSAYDLEL